MNPSNRARQRELSLKLTNRYLQMGWVLLVCERFFGWGLMLRQALIYALYATPFSMLRR